MAFTEGLCTLVQESLIMMAEGNAGELNRTPTGLLDSLVSPVNRNGYKQDLLTNSNGGVRGIELTFIQPATVNDIQTSLTKTSLCSATREVAPRAVTIDPADLEYRGINPIALSREEMAKLCDQTQVEYRQRTIMAQISALNQAINQYLLSQLDGAVGYPLNPLPVPVLGYTAPVGPHVPIAAPLVKSADNTANYPGWSSAVKKNLRDIGIFGRPIIVGAGDLGIQHYTDLVGIGCCNDAGIDLSQAGNQMYFFYDNDFDGIVGSNDFLAYNPGALQLITHNQYSVPQNVTNIPGQTNFSTIVDPFTNLEYDFQVHLDPCTQKYFINISTSVMLWAPPYNMYSNFDRRYYTNGSLLFEATLA